MINNYKFDVNNIIDVHRGKIKIIEQIRMKNGKSTQKGYKYECLECSFIGEKTETNILRKTGCNNCNIKIANEKNNMWVLNTKLAKMLANPNDGYKYTQNSKRKVDWICPHCKNIIKNKTIKNINKQGLFCYKCSDRISYPNKFMYALLNQLEVDFESEKKFKWAKKKKYDFYLYKYNCIIEMHGLQHYKGVFNKVKGRTLEQEQENDKIKEQLAKDNNINYYIVIDSRKSELNYIRNNIINSELNKLFDLSSIDWNKCYESTCKNLIKIACDLWNNNYGSLVRIGEKLKIHRYTVRRYLKKGTILGWCNYNPKLEKVKKYEKMSKKVINITTGIIYDSANQAYKQTGINNSTIAKCCKGEFLTAGKQKWMFLNNYIKNNKINNMEVI